MYIIVALMCYGEGVLCALDPADVRSRNTRDTLINTENTKLNHTALVSLRNALP